MTKFDFVGKWTSEKYSSIYGTFTMVTTHINENISADSPFEATLNLTYDKESPFKAIQVVEISLEGVSKYTEAGKEQYRLIETKRIRSKSIFHSDFWISR